MDFYQIKQRHNKTGGIELYPDFKVTRSKDLMVRGKAFYAIWDADAETWSTDEYDVQRLVDKELMAERDRLQATSIAPIQVKLMSDFSTQAWAQYRTYLNHISDSYVQLDRDLTFANSKVTKNDYVSKRLQYPLEEGTIDAWDELISVLYEPDERKKLEWSIGAVVSGDSKTIQKFIVLYGEAGGGKSTVLNIIQKLFHGYYTTFEAKALTTNGNSFSTEAFRGNPLVAIQHDGDLSRIEDNTKLNSIVSHEEMTMNEKYKPSFTARANCFLFMGTNKPVKISDGKSGIIRRLIDVRTSGKTIQNKRYQILISQIDFELGAIAHHCLDVYHSMGKNYYSGYKPLDMILQTDVFYNFVESNYFELQKEEGITLSRAYEMYKTYCDEALIEHKLPRHKFRDELRNYFENFYDLTRQQGKQVRSYFSGFITKKFVSSEDEDNTPPLALVLEEQKSILDETLKDCPAQYATTSEIPSKMWAVVNTKLGDINTSLLHYVKPPENHIVIDFDIYDNTGSKSLELNLEAASRWPQTYCELSKSHKAVHLHYIYDGDVSKLRHIYDSGIEIKTFSGNASLRRMLSKCNNLPIAHINSGLPLKGDKVLDFKTVTSEAGLRALIAKNLAKEIHPGTKPSIDFIYKILDDAYTSRMKYDLTQLRPKVLAFAANSTNQSGYCIDLVSKMKFKSEDVEDTSVSDNEYDNSPLVFFDTEVFPNLFLVSWKYAGDDKQCVRMINPDAKMIEGLLKMKLVGFNCRRYDNHILYARYIGYDLTQLFELSSKIISNSENAMFREAYNLSYADVYDFTSKKQSLKAYEVELGLVHKELGMPWDQPVPEDKWHLVAEYCDYDTIATEKTFEDRKEDFIARKILAELSGLAINDTTQMHTARILFGTDPRPQDKFMYTDLSEMFPGYKFDAGVSSYRGEDPGEGGYIYAEPGIYENVTLLDVASMHPTSILAMNAFGKYTPRYEELVNARLAIKHKDYPTAKKLLGGMLAKYLDDPEQADQLAYALKIHALNIVYGLTAAKFDNKFRDPRNIDNIVAKRGALFMIDLKYAIQEKGFKVIHIKTDSVKIPNATKELIDFIMNFGKKYGYTFENEGVFSKFCLVNDAVYIAKYAEGKDAGLWTATGAEFAQPYVFKTLFSKEPIEFKDYCLTKAVTGNSAIFLDYNETLPEGEHNYMFIGRVGLFTPVKKGKGGGLLYRKKDEKYYSVTGTKGYRWLESQIVNDNKLLRYIDKDYFNSLVDDAITHISKFGNFDEFVSEINL